MQYFINTSIASTVIKILIQFKSKFTGHLPVLEFGSLFSAGTALLYIYITNAYHRRIPDFALGVSKTFGEGGV